MSYRPKIAILHLKMAILDLKMTMDLFKNIFIWSTEKSCTVGSGIIHFDILFKTFLSLKCQKGPKMAIFGLIMAILDLKMAMDIFKNIFIWSAAKSKAKSWIYGFSIKKFIWKHFKQNNNLVFSFKKLTLWFHFWSHTTTQMS